MATKKSTKKKAVKRARGRKKVAKRGTWGGRREGAGRKPGPDPRVLHRVRSDHDADHPVLITLRAARGLPSLRSKDAGTAFVDAVRSTNDKRDDFAIVELSVLADRVHALVEADDLEALSRGMRSFAVSAARRVKQAIAPRRDRLWGDRYRRRDLTSAREVRDALAKLFTRRVALGAAGARAKTALLLAARKKLGLATA